MEFLLSACDWVWVESQLGLELNRNPEFLSVILSLVLKFLVTEHH